MEDVDLETDHILKKSIMKMFYLGQIWFAKAYQTEKLPPNHHLIEMQQ